MFPQSMTLIAAAVAILFAQTSLSAVVFRAPSDNAQLVDHGHDFGPRSETFDPLNNTGIAENVGNVGPQTSIPLPGNHTGLLKERQAEEVIGLATEVIQGVVSIFTSIQDGINKDKEARSQFTQDLVQQLHDQHPDFNWIVCHTKHDTKWDGTKGVDWAHSHREFDIKIGGTIGYEIYNAKSGKFFRKGDGGYLNWAYNGHAVKTENNGKDVTFAKP